MSADDQDRKPKTAEERARNPMTRRDELARREEDEILMAGEGGGKSISAGHVDGLLKRDLPGDSEREKRERRGRSANDTLHLIQLGLVDLNQKMDDLDRASQEVGEQLEVVDRLIELHDSGDLDPNDPEHRILMDEARVDPEDYEARGRDALVERQETLRHKLNEIDASKQHLETRIKEIKNDETLSDDQRLEQIESLQDEAAAAINRVTQLDAAVEEQTRTVADNAFEDKQQAELTDNSKMSLGELDSAMEAFNLSAVGKELPDAKNDPNYDQATSPAVNSGIGLSGP